MKTYLLDTQPLIYLASTQESKKLGKKARRVVEDENTTLLLSSISICEIVIKNQSGRYFHIPLSTVYKAIDRLDIKLTPFTSEHAAKLDELPMIPEHADPFDRMIIAVALSLDIPLIGGDKAFKSYKGLQIVWN